MDNAHEQARATALFLVHLSALLSQKRFAGWYSQNTSRFAWAGERLHEALRRDLMMQVDQCLDRQSKDAAAAHKFAILAAICARQSQYLDRQFDLKLKRKDTAFAVPAGRSVEEVVFDMLSASLYGLLRDTSSSGDAAERFYMWNAIGSLKTYVMCRDTLARPLSNPAFEKLLAGLDEDYMLRGYPHDLLAHDADDVRKGENVIGIRMVEQYCSTTLVKSVESMDDVPGYRLVRLANGLKAA